MKEVFSLKSAILATLSYFDLFDFPLTLEELERYLYGWSAPQDAIVEVIAQLPEISHAHGFYFLKNREELAELKKERMKKTGQLWKRIEHYAPLLALCPFVKMIAVCNSLALGNVNEESDIDLFVVTEEGYLATSRIFLKTLTQALGMRVRHDKIAGRFCLSFFVSEKALDLKTLSHAFDPHFAYFVITMVPIFGEKTYRAFLHENEAWVGAYFKRSIVPRLSRIRKYPVAAAARFVGQNALRIGGGFLERFCRALQSRKDITRKKKLANAEGVVMSKQIFKFHEKDPRREIAEKFMDLLKNRFS